MTDSEVTTTETRTEKSNKRKLWIGGIAAALALIVASVGITLAVTEGFDDFGDDDDTSQEVREGSNGSDGSDDSSSTDPALSDGDREKAEKAALAEVGDGTVTDVEASDDADHAYEVDVTLEDGTEVDVELDESFAVTKVDKN